MDTPTLRSLRSNVIQSLSLTLIDRVRDLDDYSLALARDM